MKKLLYLSFLALVGLSSCKQQTTSTTVAEYFAPVDSGVQVAGIKNGEYTNPGR